MIVASLMLVIAAAVTLLVGLLNREVIEWVYASIACCLLAGLLLTIGVLRSRPSRKPVLQSGGDGQTASWAGASQWGASGEADGAAVLTRDDDESDSSVRVASSPEELVGDDDPTRTDLPASAPAPQSETATSPWAPAGGDEDTGDPDDVRVVSPEPEPEPESEPEASPAAQTAADDDDIVVVPKPSSRGGKTAADAGAGAAAPQSRTAAGVVPVTTGAAAGSDDAARFEQVLSPIAGVGAGKRAALYQHFGTYRKLRAASPEKLAEVPGISRTLAERIYGALHNK